MKIKKIIALTASSAMLLAAMPVVGAAAAEDDTVYVTMNIPYSNFYKADVKNNDVEIDTVSSATESKWSSFAGTYFVADTEGVGGTILGVSFPVAMSKDVYDSLNVTDDTAANYYFENLDEAPAVYKTLTIQDGEYVFSEVQGETTVIDGAEVTISTSSVWGDYLVQLNNAAVEGTIYGMILTTEDGTQYGLRHLENIWKKTSEFSWSSGIKTVEAKGNTLSYEHYESIMGKTINDITYITDTGIYSVPVNQYVPVKIKTVPTVADTSFDADSTTVTFEPALPEDYDAVYSVEGLDCSYSDGILSYSNAKAGSYTFTVSDASEKYADITSTFILSTDNMPAAYDNENKQIVAVEGFEDDLSAYLSNITSVQVDDTSYSASGHGAISIINTEDGTIDMEAAGRSGAVFDIETKDTFNVTVTAAGYPELSFVISTKTEEPSEEQPSDEPSEEPSEEQPSDEPSEEPSDEPSSEPSDEQPFEEPSDETSEEPSNDEQSNIESEDNNNSNAPSTSDHSNGIAMIMAFVALVSMTVISVITAKRVKSR